MRGTPRRAQPEEARERGGTGGRGGGQRGGDSGHAVPVAEDEAARQEDQPEHSFGDRIEAAVAAEIPAIVG